MPFIRSLNPKACLDQVFAGEVSRVVIKELGPQIQDGYDRFGLFQTLWTRNCRLRESNNSNKR